MTTLVSRNAYKAKESRLRRKALAQDILLRKSRVQTPNGDNFGGYMLVDLHTSGVIYDSGKYDMSLDDVAEYLAS